jgi:hypothetical protein
VLNAKAFRPLEQQAKDNSANIAVTNLVTALNIIEPQDITPHLMCLLEELKRSLSRDQFNELLDDLLFTIALFKRGA